MASPFFFPQKQKLQKRTTRAFSRLWNWISRRRSQVETDSVNEESEPSYTKFSFWSFAISVLGSVAISLAAPLLAGISISKNHPNANRWVLIEQWSTHPRASLFVVLVNLIAALFAHKGMMDMHSAPEGPHQVDGYLETAATALATEVFVSLFGIKFIYDQTDTPCPEDYQSTTPCTTLGDAYGDPSNCPNMQRGANGLAIAIVFNAFVSFLWFLAGVLGSEEAWLTFLLILPFATFVIYKYSWDIWANFLNTAPDSLYCIESSTPTMLFTAY
jgi:hypothetical protein